MVFANSCHSLKDLWAVFGRLYNNNYRCGDVLSDMSSAVLLYWIFRWMSLSLQTGSSWITTLTGFDTMICIFIFETVLIAHSSTFVLTLSFVWFCVTQGASALFDMIEYYESATHLNISFNKHIGTRGWQAAAHMMRKVRTIKYLQLLLCLSNSLYISQYKKRNQSECMI